jgi:purine-cytosine permease-like protein
MKKQNWFELAAIQLGGAICLPVILIGFQLGRLHGIGGGLVCLFLANLFLFGFAYVGVRLARESDRSTIETIELFFGKKGKPFFALFMIASLLIWFAIQAQMASRDLYSVAQTMGYSGGREVFCFAVTLFMVIVPLFGLEGISKVADWSVPFMLLGMCMAGIASLVTGSLPQERSSISFSAESFCLVVAANIIAASDMPTFFRHAKDFSHARRAIVATFLIGIPAIESLGLCVGTFSQNRSFPEALCPGDGSVIRAAFALFIFLAALTTNNVNFYSAKISFDSVDGISPQLRKPILAFFALCVSSMPIFDHFEGALCFFSYFWVSMGAALLTSYLFVRYKGRSKNSQQHSWISFTAGLGASFITSYFKEEVAMMSGLFITIASFVILEKLSQKKEIKNVPCTF